MTTESGKRYCVHCERVIEGPAEEIVVHSASGARPNEYRHPACGPAQAPYVRRSPYGR
ncbi:hypothetical protein [Streptomyces sp. TRM64462]|uniref:hypothetical protein n=1 Tax=Streptomyces sp. TRM64462 TaxID=2741726 RepID=UPI001585F4C6|nr:hypothetical protein [Streptomyces sp. TRM64462]